LRDAPRARLMQGNEACAEAAIRAGLGFFAGYPITPATEIAEVLARRLPQVGGDFIQMEDELSSMGAIIGASLGGKKAMTATSGPGFTLMQENLGFAIMTEIPCVIVNVQRGGPSTGMPTLPAQGDMMQARWGTHGDHPIIALSPSSVAETYDLTIKAFNLAERFRTPVVLLTDAVVAHVREKVYLPQEVEVVERKRPKVPPESYKPYAPDEDGIPPMVPFGEGYRFHITSNVYDETGFPATNDHAVANKLIRRLHDKIYSYRQEYTFVEYDMMDDAQIAVFAYGSVARSARQAVRESRERGIKVGLLKAMTLWPFPDEAVQEVADRVKAIIVPEMNLGQIIGEVTRASKDKKARVIGVNQIGGLLVRPAQILGAIEEVAQDG